MTRRLAALWTFLLLLLLPADGAEAHHGIASLGVAGLEGPGAPIEMSSSVTLPRRSLLISLKQDYARFERFTPERDDESLYSSYWMIGLGYGFTSYLSAYVFLPHNTKVLEDDSFNTSGFADMSLVGALGFKWDEGLRLTPENESLDDWEDWHFSLYGGMTFPTGDANLDQNGEIDPGMSLGFGNPSFLTGFTVTKLFHDRFTFIGEASYIHFLEYEYDDGSRTQFGGEPFIGEASYIHFLEYEYDDGSRTQFGGELRLNSALVYRLFSLSGPKLRLDANLELDYLRLGRDKLNGEGECATGGQMLYVSPGLRGYWRNVSLAFGVKVPTWTDLNEEDDQQGGEGKEHYRLVATLSVLF
jgi:hypothetical protein